MNATVYRTHKSHVTECKQSAYLADIVRQCIGSARMQAVMYDFVPRQFKEEGLVYTMYAWYACALTSIKYP